MKLIGLYSGAYILKHKDERGFKLGRSRQTAKSAYNGIVKKYGTVKPGSKYRHVGKGVWRIYSISNDRKRTGKTTTDKKKWAKQPHKLDYKGIDTKGTSRKAPKREDFSKYIKLFRKYMHACNIKQVNGEIVITCIDKPEAIYGVKMYLSDTGYKNYEKAGKVVIVGGPSVSFKTKPPLAKFEGRYKDFIYKVDTKKGIITFSHPKLTGMGDYTTGPTYFNVNTSLKKDIVELAERMINKTLMRITRQLAPAQLSQREVREATRINPASGYQSPKKYYNMKADGGYIKIWNSYVDYVAGIIGERKFRKICEDERTKAFDRHRKMQMTGRDTVERKSALKTYNDIANLCTHRLNEIKKIKREKRK